MLARSLIVRLCLIVTGILGAEDNTVPASAESLPSAVERAILRNPDVRSAYLQHFAADAGIDAATAGKKPKVGVTAEGGVEDGGPGSAETYSMSATFTQPLYDGGETRSQIRRSKAETEAARSRYEDAIITTALQAVQAYIEVQRSRRMTDISQRNLKSLRAIEKRVKQRARSGFASMADVLQAGARVEGARQQLVTAQQQSGDATAEYRLLVGHAPDRLETMDSPRHLLPQSADEAVRLAARHSPKIMAVTYDALAADAAADALTSAARPRLNLNLSLDYDESIGGGSDDRLDGTALLVFRYDLDDGGVRKARERQARYRASASHQEAVLATQSVEREIRLSWNAILGAEGRAASLKQRARSAKSSLDLNLQRFDAGMAGLETLLSLQDEAAGSEIAYVNELASGRFNVYRVLAGTGRLLPALGKGFSSIEDLR
jgi:adhesin transport system outer membrane protein